MNPRKAVYQALLTVYRDQGFFADALSCWQKSSRLSERDFRFAYDLGLGTIRRTWSLDAIAKELVERKKLTLKLKEKVLLRMAIYQVIFMDSVPLYAAADQMMKLATSAAHPVFCKFFNVLLHKLDGFVWRPPLGDLAEDLSIRYSFPLFFTQQLISDYGLDLAKHAMTHLNQIHPPMMRMRPDMRLMSLPQGETLKAYTKNSQFYVQNATPVHLIECMKERLPKAPARILDLCASPGGKSILLHDLFPGSQLVANEKSPARIPKLEENFKKYRVKGTIVNEDGVSMHSKERFDLIVVDAPCSNSGVLGKKPEARLRLDPEHLDSLICLQKKLLAHSKNLLKKNGQIWYLTCSILKQEHMHNVLGLEPLGDAVTILPNEEGWDGGFARCFKRL